MTQIKRDDHRFLRGFARILIITKRKNKIGVIRVICG